MDLEERRSRLATSRSSFSGLNDDDRLKLCARLSSDSRLTQVKSRRTSKQRPFAHPNSHGGCGLDHSHGARTKGTGIMPRMERAWEVALLERCQHNDFAAWAELILIFDPYVTFQVQHMLGRRGCDKNLVEEIAADVWVNLWLNRDAQFAGFDSKRWRLRAFLSLRVKDAVIGRLRCQATWFAGIQLLPFDILDQRVAYFPLHVGIEDTLSQLSPKQKDYVVSYQLNPSERHECQAMPRSQRMIKHRAFVKIVSFCHAD
jgi:hypothetical protein